MQRRAFLAALFAVPAAAVLPVNSMLDAYRDAGVRLNTLAFDSRAFVRTFDPLALPITRMDVLFGHANLTPPCELCDGDVVTFAPECGMGDGEHVIRRLV